eukprot:5844104-Alexandrium_andersonii.AAC.1
MPRPPAGPPPAHRLQDRGPPPGARQGFHGGGYRPPSRHEALVSAVKHFQTASQRNRRKWHEFADANLGGTRD